MENVTQIRSARVGKLLTIGCHLPPKATNFAALPESSPTTRRPPGVSGRTQPPVPALSTPPPPHLLQLVSGVDDLDRVLDLLLQELEEALGAALAAVLLLGRVAVTEQLQSRVLADVKPRRELVWR